MLATLSLVDNIRRVVADHFFAWLPTHPMVLDSHMTLVLVFVFILGCLGAAAIAAATLGGGVKGFKTERFEKNADEDLDGFSALFVGGMMATTGALTLILISIVIVFCAWRFFSTIY